MEISSSLAGILVTSTPLFTALLAIWVDHEERSQGVRLGGVLLGVIGVASCSGSTWEARETSCSGGLAVVLAGLGYAIGALMVKHRFSDVAPIGVAAWVMVASTAWLTPRRGGRRSRPRHPASAPWRRSSCSASWARGSRSRSSTTCSLRVGPARTWVLTYLAPGFAVVYGATLLDETITVATLAGLALILAGSWLAAEGRLPTRRRVAAATSSS